MEILKVDNLVKTYGKGETKINAVDNVSFTVNKGEFVAIVGASGSGKSTLLHLIGGVDRPTSGKVYIDGKDIYSLNNDNLAIFRRRQIGLIYQFYNLIPILNVEENITLPCDLDGTTVDKQRLQDLLKTLGLENRKTHLPNQLSGGQQQRVSIGRAMINNPSIMLADEPTGNLDSKASEEIISLLKLSNKKFNQTVIIITHDLEIAKEAERVITIEDGILDGGFGEKISRFYGPTDMKVINYGLKKEFLDRYDVNEVLRENHLTKEEIVEDVMALMK